VTRLQVRPLDGFSFKQGCARPLSGWLAPGLAGAAAASQPESFGAAAAEKQTARRLASRIYQPLPPPPKLLRHSKTP